MLKKISHDKTSDSTASVDSRRDEKVRERRTSHVKALWHSVFKEGRRRGSRRDEDSERGQVQDYHEPVLFYLTIAVLLLCVADAFFTMNILSKGGEEVNPVMKALLEVDVVLFFIVKFILTAIFLLVTVVYKRFKIFNLISGYHLLIGIFLIYLTLIFYESYLIYNVA